MRSPFIKYIQNEQHYTEVISRVATVKESLWFGTADIKDLYVMKGKETVPFLSSLAELLKKGVEVRLIHAKEPGTTFFFSNVSVDENENRCNFLILFELQRLFCCPTRIRT